LHPARDIVVRLADDLPEQAFYLVGTIDDVRAKAERLARGEAR